MRIRANKPLNPLPGLGSKFKSASSTFTQSVKNNKKPILIGGGITAGVVGTGAALTAGKLSEGENMGYDTRFGVK